MRACSHSWPEEQEARARCAAILAPLCDPDARAALDCCEALLPLCDPSARDLGGRQAWEYALSQGREELSDLLRRAARSREETEALGLAIMGPCRAMAGPGRRAEGRL